jgi:hypothetical protein
MTSFLVLVSHSGNPGKKTHTKLENFVADAWSCLNAFLRKKRSFLVSEELLSFFNCLQKFVITFLQFGESSELYFEKLLLINAKSTLGCKMHSN